MYFFEMTTQTQDTEDAINKGTCIFCQYKIIFSLVANMPMPSSAWFQQNCDQSFSLSVALTKNFFWSNKNLPELDLIHILTTRMILDQFLINGMDLLWFFKSTKIELDLSQFQQDIVLVFHVPWQLMTWNKVFEKTLIWSSQ